MPCSLPPTKVLDGSPIEVTLAKPVDKDSYVRYTRGTGGRAPVLQGDYTYTLGHLYDPAAAYLGAPVFYAPQAYTAIPNLHFPTAKGLGNRSILRPPSVRGKSPPGISPHACWWDWLCPSSYIPLRKGWKTQGLGSVFPRAEKKEPFSWKELPGCPQSSVNNP